MSDTGRIPGEGLPENAGMVEQPGAPAPDSYTYLEPSAHTPEDDDLLLMPSAQGAWGEPQPAPAPGHFADGTAVPDAYQQPHAQGPVQLQEQVPVQVPEYAMQQAAAEPLPQNGRGAHETGGRDSGSVDLGGVRIPAPTPAAAPQPQTPARRPLHRGPASPEPSYGGTSGAGVVRSLADRGPAGAPQTQAPAPSAARHAGPATAEPEYFEPPLPGPQLGAIPPQDGYQWTAQPTAPEPVAQAPAAETVVPEPVAKAAVPVAAPVDQPVVVAEAPVADEAVRAEVEPAPVDGYVPVAEQPAEQSIQPEATAPAPVAEPAPAVEPAPVLVSAPVEPEPEQGPEVIETPDLSGEAEPVEKGAPEPVQEPVQPEQAAGAPGIEAPEAAEIPAADEIPAAAAVPEVPAVPEAPATAEAAAAPEAAVLAEASQAAGPAEATALPVPPAASETPETAETAATAENTEPTEPTESAEATEPTESPEAVVAAEPAEVPLPAEAPVEVPAVAEASAAEAPEAPEAPHTDEETGPESVQAEVQAPAPAPEAEPGPKPEGEAPEETRVVPPPAPGYDDAEREAVLRVMRERRDIRNGFRSDPVPHEVLLRVLEAAHTAPSVGHSQPWDFVVIRSAETRRSMHELAQQQREAYAKSLPKARAKQFKELKIEAILDTPVNIVVTADPTRGGRHTLGRHTQPQMAPYSSALAVENLWLAARAEGLGVGWVSFFDEREMVRALGLPEHLEVVAYLCVGYVDEFPEDPELMQAGWSKRRPLSWVVHEETYGRRALPGEAPHDLLQETISNIRPLDAKALGEAWERQKRMTKPAGALGMLEIISAQLAGLSRLCPPPIPEPAAVAVFAGDHGVHAQGVTAWPQEVTGQMIANMLGGGAVCNAFAAQVGAEVCVVDVGAVAELPATPGLLPRKVRAGTADFTAGPALTREEVHAAIEVGIETARDLVAAGNKALLTGEMGIANTTASAALICVYTGMDPVEVTGRGTGINDEMHARKIDVVRRALELHQPDPADPIGVLAAVGGLEHAAMAGFLLGGASLRTPVILDGVSAGAAALVARAIAPEALAACIAGHRSAEPGHVAALNKLGLRPLVDLDLRLGEGTGALLALPIVQSAARAMHEVATFDSAGVTEK
ncbi:nicotinate-nucleotide--dimethylbenzimidazole phosphoribosyltransferase [Streptomyces castrisilvae]|uniref:Nicotinate-nucleotide--dimethylbenzimidazole phosphoribosyltransferase n=1 Tax=Streptomyces castrisilvae TaxID=3033811 RepID=A0ABY9HE34_9ACTN|nr:nicotinate-nucleotide--dimethylbenzimidazole phosphoribosyltransferase [Streptomyces sp. Mut1]WLQ32781.1 nicotinate-nucleotide--dimethylbenzimidazole phosphoribosyltransferase [Streptomyces sp. Mut1]